MSQSSRGWQSLWEGLTPTAQDGVVSGGRLPASPVFSVMFVNFTGISVMGLRMTGKAEVSKPTRCNWCGAVTMNLVKIHSKEDKSTLRICEKHYVNMGRHPRNWDLWVAVAFPKWDKKVFHRDGDNFLTEAKWFLKNERLAAQLISKEKRNDRKRNSDDHKEEWRKLRDVIHLRREGDAMGEHDTRGAGAGGGQPVLCG